MTAHRPPRRPRLGRRQWLRSALAGLVLVFAGAATDTGVARAAPADAPSRAPLTVFAAASLKESMDEAAAAYGKATGVAVRVSYAGSPALARQIEQGAPADVFVSADLDWMDALQSKGLVDTATRRELLGNTLVVVAPNPGDARPLDLNDGIALRTRIGDGRMATALSDSVPAGKYAKAAFTRLGWWKSLRDADMLVESENVRTTLLLVARGEVPLGVVYGSDAKAEPRVRVVATVPADYHPPIVYPVARLRASTHPQAAAFVRWLQSPAAAALFRAHGFTTR